MFKNIFLDKKLVCGRQGAKNPRLCDRKNNVPLQVACYKEDTVQVQM